MQANAEGGFCYKLPEKYVAKPNEDRGGMHKRRMYVETTNNGSLQIAWGGALTDYDNILGGMKKVAEDPKNKLLESGDLPGGKGYFFYLQTESNGVRAEMLVKGSKHLVSCFVNAFPDQAAKDWEVCKSLTTL